MTRIRLLTLLLLVAGFQSAAVAQNNVMSVMSVSGKPGGRVDIPVALTNSVVVAGLQMRLQIDSPHAGIDSIRATDRSKGMMVTWNAGNGKLIMIDLSMENMIQPGQGPILTVRYRINASAPADTIRVSAREVTLSDPDGKAIPVRTVDGALTVKTR